MKTTIDQRPPPPTRGTATRTETLRAGMSHLTWLAMLSAAVAIAMGPPFLGQDEDLTPRQGVESRSHVRSECVSCQFPDPFSSPGVVTAFRARLAARKRAMMGCSAVGLCW